MEQLRGLDPETQVLVGLYALGLQALLEDEGTDKKVNESGEEAFSQQRQASGADRDVLRKTVVDLTKENQKLSEEVERLKGKVRAFHRMTGLVKGVQYSNVEMKWSELERDSAKNTKFWRNCYLLMLASTGNSLLELKRFESRGLDLRDCRTKEDWSGLLLAIIRSSVDEWKLQQAQRSLKEFDPECELDLDVKTEQEIFDQNKLSIEKAKELYPSLFVDSQEACEVYKSAVTLAFALLGCKSFKIVVGTLSHCVEDEKVSVLQVQHAWMAQKGSLLAKDMVNFIKI